MSTITTTFLTEARPTITETAAQRQDYSRLNAKLESLYKFLPKTGVFLNAGYSYQAFTYDTDFSFTLSEGADPLTGRNQAVGILKANTGITGVLTPNDAVIIASQ